MTVTRQGYTDIVDNYQVAQDEQYLEEMVIYLENSLNQITLEQLRRVAGYGYTYGDVESEVLWTLWEVMEDFNGSRGSDFLGYFRQRVQWRINDELIERKGSLADEQYYNALSINDSEDSEERGGICPNQLFYTDSELADINYCSTYGQILYDYQNQQGLHANIAKVLDADVAVLEVIFEAVECNEVSDREVNARLYEAFPDTLKSTVRRRKLLATERFGKYILAST